MRPILHLHSINIIQFYNHFEVPSPPKTPSSLFPSNQKKLTNGRKMTPRVAEYLVRKHTPCARHASEYQTTY